MFENLIALCPACHARYLAEVRRSSNEKSLQFLRQKKQELMIEDTTNSILPRHAIEEGVDRLLRKIQDDLIELSDDDLQALRLNYDPVKVRQKIPGDTREQRKLLMKRRLMVSPCPRRLSLTSWWTGSIETRMKMWRSAP